MVQVTAVFGDLTYKFTSAATYACLGPTRRPIAAQNKFSLSSPHTTRYANDKTPQCKS